MPSESQNTQNRGLQSEIEQRVPFQHAETEAFLNLARTFTMLNDPVERFMHQHGLTTALYNVLRILRGAGEPVTCSTISRRMLTRVPDVTRLIDRLVAKGLAERNRTDEDRRLVLVNLSPAGRTLLAEMDEPVEALHTSKLGHMTAEELARLNELLVKARQQLRES